MKRAAYLGMSLGLVFAFTVSGFGQQPQWKSKAEYDAYNAAYTEKSPAKKAELSEKFVNDFAGADVTFRTDAYLMMVKAYSDSQNYPKAIETASKFADVIPAMAKDRKAAQIYSIGLDAASKAD